MGVWILAEGSFNQSSLQNISSSVRFDNIKPQIFCNIQVCGLRKLHQNIVLRVSGFCPVFRVRALLKYPTLKKRHLSYCSKMNLACPGVLHHTSNNSVCSTCAEKSSCSSIYHAVSPVQNASNSSPSCCMSLELVYNLCSLYHLLSPIRDFLGQPIWTLTWAVPVFYHFLSYSLVSFPYTMMLKNLSFYRSFDSSFEAPMWPEMMQRATT